MKDLQPPIEVEKPENDSNVDYLRTVAPGFKHEEEFDDVSF